ncbi:hypothetical protein [Budvicia diplopodorum]|uniref:hypothetical protein n=1 Tax=Budvicia diplopodorum TaxID=1119056 RepID=UPI00135AF46E|nr:hypothetical protein [Budvicia diplopodorum]
MKRVSDYPLIVILFSAIDVPLIAVQPDSQSLLKSCISFQTFSEYRYNGHCQIAVQRWPMLIKDLDAQLELVMASERFLWGGETLGVDVIE